MKLNREDLVVRLKVVSPGLMTKGIVEQGNCFIFQDGLVITFSEEISCRTTVDLHIKGAVVALPFLELLENMEDDQLQFKVKGNKLQMFGTAKSSGAQFLLQEKITLPLSSLEPPEVWKRLPEHFIDALALVQECTSSKKTTYALTCVHLHPEWMEATDKFQIARYKMKIPIEESILVPKDSIKHIVQLEPYSFAVSPSWIHFRTKDKQTVISCRCSKEAFKDYTDFLKTAKGEKAVLPKGLEGATKRASILSKETPNNKVLVEIKKDLIRVWGKGITGEFYEDESGEYEGKTFSFLISPNLLMELVQKHTECFLSDKLIKVQLGAFVYCAGVGKVDKEKEND